MPKHTSNQWIATKLMGREHWCTDWLAELLLADADLLEHILKQGSEYRHYLCLINMGRDRLIYSGYDELARMIRRKPRKKMLKAVLDPCPDGLSRVLKNLHKRPLLQRGYIRLIKLMSDKRARKFLSHSNSVSPVQLRLLERLPPALRDCPFIMDIKSKADMNLSLETIEDVHHFAPAVSYADMALSLRHVSDPTRSRIYRRGQPFDLWYENQLLKKDFPAPPWLGNNWIKPITSGPELRQIGRTMRNCVAKGHYIKDVLNGEAYFYVTDQEPKILILFQKHKDDTWRLVQAAGNENKQLDRESATYILRKLQGEGFNMLDDQLPYQYKEDEEDDMLTLDLLDGYSFEDEKDKSTSSALQTSKP